MYVPTVYVSPNAHEEIVEAVFPCIHTRGASLSRTPQINRQSCLPGSGKGTYTHTVSPSQNIGPHATGVGAVGAGTGAGVGGGVGAGAGGGVGRGVGRGRVASNLPAGMA